MSTDDEIVESHPSYATIQIHRAHGGGQRLLPDVHQGCR